LLLQDLHRGAAAVHHRVVVLTHDRAGLVEGGGTVEDGHQDRREPGRKMASSRCHQEVFVWAPPAPGRAEVAVATPPGAGRPAGAASRAAAAGFGAAAA